MKKKVHDQELFFDNGTRRIIWGVVKMERGTWWHIFTKDGEEFIINPERVLFIRVTDA